MKLKNSQISSLSPLQGRILHWFEDNHIGCASTVSAGLFLDVSETVRALGDLESKRLVRVTDKKVHLPEAKDGEHAYELA